MTAPTPREVNQFHEKSDVDSHPAAHHHRLGLGHNQASPGDHKHDGRNSSLLLKGFNPSFPLLASATYSQSEMQQVFDALRELGLGQ